MLWIRLYTDCRLTFSKKGKLIQTRITNIKPQTSNNFKFSTWFTVRDAMTKHNPFWQCTKLVDELGFQLNPPWFTVGYSNQPSVWEGQVKNQFPIATWLYTERSVAPTSCDYWERYPPSGSWTGVHRCGTGRRAPRCAPRHAAPDGPGDTAEYGCIRY